MAAAPSSAPRAVELYPACREGKWGYIDRAGRMVIEPLFGETRPFAEGLAPVRVGTSDRGSWGYLNEHGAMVVMPQFDEAQAFRDGAAAVKLPEPPSTRSYRRGTRALIGRAGGYLLEPTLLAAEGFSEGLAFVRFGEDNGFRAGYVDRTGRLLLEPAIEGGERFSEGLARVWKDGRYGYLTTRGEFAIPPAFERPFFEDIDACDGAFSEGLACVQVKGLWGYVDTRGKTVIKPQFERADRFAEGVARVGVKGRWGYIDHRGRWVIKPRFRRTGGFSEGLAFVDLGGTFSEDYGRAGEGVLSGGHWGYIDHSGLVVIEIRAHEVESFSNGLARVWVEDRFGYIDRSGQYVWPPTN